jgi:hypothetical protein
VGLAGDGEGGGGGVGLDGGGGWIYPLAQVVGGFHFEQLPTFNALTSLSWNNLQLHFPVFTFSSWYHAPQVPLDVQLEQHSACEEVANWWNAATP